MNIATTTEQKDKVIDSFKEKYPNKEIWRIAIVDDIIFYYTSNAKIWVDMPEYFGDYTVKMSVGKKPT